MNPEFESSILHNRLLGAKVLWQFCRMYQENSVRGVPASLPEAMLVLPMIFHKRTARAISRMQFDSGLLKALADAPDIVIRLSERLHSHSKTTLVSLSVACASGLLARVPGAGFPCYRARPSLPRGLTTDHGEVRQMLAASRRLGHWFPEDDFAVICNLLQVHI